MQKHQLLKRERGEASSSASTKPALKRPEVNTSCRSGASNECPLYDPTVPWLGGEVFVSPTGTDTSRLPRTPSASLVAFDFVYRPDMPFHIVSRKSSSTTSNHRSASRTSVIRADLGSSSGSLGPEISGAGYIADRLADFMSLGIEECPKLDKDLEIESDLTSPSYRLKINGGKWFNPRPMDLMGPPLPKHICVTLDNVSYAVLALAHALRVDNAARTVEEGQILETIPPTTEPGLRRVFNHGPTTALRGALSELRTTFDTILQPGAFHAPDDTSGDHSKDIKTKISRLRTTFCWAGDHPSWEIYTVADGETVESRQPEPECYPAFRGCVSL